MTYSTCPDCGQMVVHESGFAHACAKPSDPVFALAVLEMRLKVLEEDKAKLLLQNDELRKALTRIDALRKRLPDPDFGEQRNTAAGIAEIVQVALSEKRNHETECEDSNYPCPKCKRIHG